MFIVDRDSLGRPRRRLIEDIDPTELKAIRKEEARRWEDEDQAERTWEDEAREARQTFQTFTGNDGIVREYDPETARLIGHDEDAIIEGDYLVAVVEVDGRYHAHPLSGRSRTIAVFSRGVLAAAFRDLLFEKMPGRQLFLVNLPEKSETEWRTIAIREWHRANKAEAKTV